MLKNGTFVGFLALIFAFTAGPLLPASAEMYGCDGQSRTRAVCSYARSQASISRYTHEFAAQSHPRITIYPRRRFPGRDAKRHCQSWLAKEYRVSGPVIVPKMRCWWE
jgi:hypothetical protein